MKTRVKQYKKEPANGRWNQLIHFTKEDQVYPTYTEIVSKMAGQRNLLFIFEFISESQKMIGVYHTFGQVDHQSEKKNQSSNQQKASVPNQTGDFMFIGNQETMKIAVLPDLINQKHVRHGGAEAEPTAMTFHNINNQPKAKVKVKSSDSSNEGQIKIGSIHQN